MIIWAICRKCDRRVRNEERCGACDRCGCPYFTFRREAETPDDVAQIADRIAEMDRRFLALIHVTVPS